MASKSGDLITTYTCGRAAEEMAVLRLVEFDAVVNQISYATAGGVDAVGRTEDPVLTADITNENTLVTIGLMKDQEHMTMIASEAIAINTRVKVSTLGRVRAIETNATPEAQNIIGTTLEAVTAANSQVLVRIYREVITQ